MRRAFLFSLDALIGALILIAGLVLLAKVTENDTNNVQVATAGDDTMTALSAINVADLTDPWVQAMVANGTIANANISVLTQVGDFWAIGDNASATRLAQLLIGQQYQQYGMILSIDGTTLYQRNTSYNGKNAYVSSRMISGVAQGQALTGSSAAGYLKHIRNKRDTLYIPFGGFVGEGNMSVIATGLPSDGNVTDISIQLDTQQSFNFYINGHLCDYLVPTNQPLVPTSWDRENCSRFINPGQNNTISLNSSGVLNGSAIYGGAITMLYTTSQYSTVTTSTIAYQFPSINGLINLFDGFYIGGTINSMNITLHFLSNYPTYLTIGNASISFGASNVTQNFTLNNTQVLNMLTAAGLNYSSIIRQTIPLRFGIGNVITTGTPAQVIIVSDTSGSMIWCTNQTQAECDDTCGCGPCSSGGGTCGSSFCGLYATCAPNDSPKISASVNDTKGFVLSLLNNSGTQVGLAQFADSILSYQNLTTNSTPLLNTLNTYAANGGTCICCGINEAVSLLSQTGQITFIARSASGWKYNDSNLGSPPAGWNTTGFNDTGWRNGTTNMGWGYAGQNTIIANQYQGDYYERYTFNVSSAASIQSAVLSVYSDDGADVYLNGVRISNNYGTIYGSGVYWNINVSVNASAFVNGKNVIAVRQYHKSSPNKMGFDLQLTASTKSNSSAYRQSIILMTDGQSNDVCAQQNTGDPLNDAILAACQAYTNYGITVYTVGFGRDADNVTLQSMANCTGGKYYPAANSAALNASYSAIGNTIIQASSTQTAIVSGNVSTTVLYGDSAIYANYTPDITPPQANELSVTLQTPPFGNCTATVPIYAGMRFINAEVNSFTGDYWTSLVALNGIPIYNLTTYAPIYASLGDPYQITIPTNDIIVGNNTIQVVASFDNTNTTGTCSLNNTMVYTVAINLSTERSQAVAKIAGCTWTVAYQDGTKENLTIPTTYNGNNQCSYQPGNISYDPTDAYQLGAYNVMSKLDFEQDGKLFVDLNATDLEVIVTTVSNVPYMWGPSTATLETVQ